jgi:DdrB-like nuclease
MSIFQGEARQFGTPARTARPAPDGFTGEVAAAFEAGRRTQNINSFDLLEKEAYGDQIDAVEQETGAQLPSPFAIRAFDEVNDFFKADDLERNMRLGGSTVGDITRFRVKKNKEAFNERLTALRGKFPGAQSLFDRTGLEDRMKKRAQSLEARASEVGLVPGLVGGFGAALTDPITLATAPVGISAKTLLGAVVKNAALNAGIETVLQPGVQAARERLGLPSGLKEGAINIAFAGGAGGALGGGSRLLADLIGLGRASPDPKLRAGAAELERDAEIAATASEAAGDTLDAPAQAAHRERLEAVQRIIEDETPAPKDIATARAEGEPVKISPIRRDVAVTAAGREINVEYGLVELAALIPSHTRSFARNPSFPAGLQPRDRGRAASAAQVARIAADLNPRLLDDAADAGAGAPIIAADGVVESGNGRVLALDKVYAAAGERAKAYKDYLISRNYPADDFAEPVLVRKRLDNLDDQAREAFTREANSRNTAAMSAVEQAASDAKAINPRDFDLLDGDNPAAVKNAQFTRQMIDRIAPEAERGALMDKSGRLSPEGANRMRNAIFAYAYDDEALIARLLDGGDELKSLGNAMLDAAPEWGRLRADLDNGTVDTRVDMRPFLAEAANLVAEARRAGRNVAEFAGQTDIFAGALDARTLAFMRLFFRNEDFTGARARAKIAEELNFYAREARKTDTGPKLFEDVDDPGTRILDAVRGRDGGDPNGSTPGLFDPVEDGGPASLLPEADRGSGGAEAPGGRIGEVDAAAQIARAADDLEGLAENEPLVTGLALGDEGADEITFRTQTKQELAAEFAADEAAINRLKGCI